MLKENKQNNSEYISFEPCDSVNLSVYSWIIHSCQKSEPMVGKACNKSKRLPAQLNKKNEKMLNNTRRLQMSKPCLYATDL